MEKIKKEFWKILRAAVIALLITCWLNESLPRAIIATYILIVVLVAIESGKALYRAMYGTEHESDLVMAIRDALENYCQKRVEVLPILEEFGMLCWLMATVSVGIFWPVLAFSFFRWKLGKKKNEGEI